MRKSMKQIMTMLLCITMLCGCLMGCEKEKGTEQLESHTYSIADIKGQYKSQGRTEATANGLLLPHTAASFEFTAYCEGDVTLELNASSIPEETGYGIYFSVYVDGELENEKLKVKRNETQSLTIVKGLEEGEHLIQLYRQTENKRGSIQIRTLTIAGELLEAPEDKNIFIEFVGDGLTSGVGNKGGGTMSNLVVEAPQYQNGTKSFAFLTAQYLDADVSIVAEHGAALICCGEGDSISDKYDYFPNTLYPYKVTREPDFIVLNLGTMDYLTRFDYEKSLTDIKNEMVSFAETIKEKNPQAKIVLVSGMMEETLKEYAMAAVEELGGESAGYYYQQLVYDTKGLAGYTSDDGHEDSAAVLANFFMQEFGL